MILSSAYLAPLEYYKKMRADDSVLIEHHEHFLKQTYRSRCEIYSPNGKQTLSIPLVDRNHRQSMKDVKISYDYNWQHLHWKSMESAYRRSPFFEFYEDDFRHYYEERKFEFLLDLNEELQQLVMSSIKLKKNYTFTTEYKTNYEEIEDCRNTITPKVQPHDTESIKYTQVFESRHGFIPNLSIVDLLFNQGPRALDYI